MSVCAAKLYFDQINVVYGAIVDNCTPKTCPTMCAPFNHQFYWIDDKNKKYKYSASQYIDTVLTFAAKKIADGRNNQQQSPHLFAMK